LLLCGGGGLLALNQSRLQASMHWVQHTEQVLLQVMDLNLAVVDAESAARAVSITGNAAYRESFYDAQASMQAHLASLRRLVTDNPVQVGRLDATAPLLEERFAFLARIVEADREERESLLTPDNVERSLDLRRRIRAELDQFRASEVSLLEERNASTTQAASLLSGLALLTGAAGMAIGGFGLFLLQRERNRQRVRELQSELHHLSRLTMIGQTASMLAHEIKQPLSAAVTYLEAATRLQASPAGGAKVADTLQKAAVQVRRAGDIVGRLRGFVDKRETSRGIEPVQGLIDDAVLLLGPLAEAVELEIQVSTDLPPLNVDRVQVQQVLLNLMRNAIEAMAESPRRSLRLAATREGEQVAIIVADSGPGLPEEVRRQLFRPFVSTKSEGMGVGLSICRTIVVEHGGTITGETAPEGGTVFRFTLPVARARSAA
jgi:C4-dicarboxylate-specific signal transduction histidine kinase